MSAPVFAGAYADGYDLFATYDNDDEAIIDPRTIREAGWKRQDENDPCEQDHCGTEDCTCGDLSPEATAIIETWHNETHDGVFRFCAESPCREIGSL